MAAARVLLVDDNPINVELMTILLESEGFEVEPVQDAETALQHIRQTLPDLMVVDVQLPGMSGLDLLRQVRSEPHSKDLCTIVVTSYAMATDRESAYEAGCNGYITKPVDTRTFGHQVSELFTARRR